MNFSEDTIRRFRYCKVINKLTYQKLSEAPGIHAEMLTAWIGGKQRPIRRNTQKIEGLLKADDGILLERLGKMIGIDARAVTNWEGGRTEPEIRYIPKIVNFPDYVFA